MAYLAVCLLCFSWRKGREKRGYFNHPLPVTVPSKLRDCSRIGRETLIAGGELRAAPTASSLPGASYQNPLMARNVMPFYNDAARRVATVFEKCRG